MIYIKLIINWLICIINILWRIGIFFEKCVQAKINFSNLPYTSFLINRCLYLKIILIRMRLSHKNIWLILNFLQFNYMNSLFNKLIYIFFNLSLQANPTLYELILLLGFYFRNKIILQIYLLALFNFWKLY